MVGAPPRPHPQGPVGASPALRPSDGHQPGQGRFLGGLASLLAWLCHHQAGLGDGLCTLGWPGQRPGPCRLEARGDSSGAARLRWRQGWLQRAISTSFVVDEGPLREEGCAARGPEGSPGPRAPVLPVASAGGEGCGPTCRREENGREDECSQLCSGICGGPPAASVPTATTGGGRDPVPSRGSE